MKKYNVLVKAYNNPNYQELITKETVIYKTAERIENGISINLNADEYYTEIEEVEV